MVKTLGRESWRRSAPSRLQSVCNPTANGPQFNAVGPILPGALQAVFIYKMAEGVGFEPTVRPEGVQRFSSSMRGVRGRP